jgi:hypothetical protein
MTPIVKISQLSTDRLKVINSKHRRKDKIKYKRKEMEKKTA